MSNKQNRRLIEELPGSYIGAVMWTSKYCTLILSSTLFLVVTDKPSNFSVVFFKINVIHDSNIHALNIIVRRCAVQPLWEWDQQFVASRMTGRAVGNPVGWQDSSWCNHSDDSMMIGWGYSHTTIYQASILKDSAPFLIVSIKQRGHGGQVLKTKRHVPVVMSSQVQHLYRTK